MAKAKPVTSTGVSEDMKTLITAIALMMAYPIGLILMWAWTNWPRWVKALVTLPLLLFILAMIAGSAVGFALLRAQHQPEERPLNLPATTSAIYTK